MPNEGYVEVMTAFRLWLNSLKRRIFWRLGLVMQTDLMPLYQETAALREEAAVLHQKTAALREEATVLRQEATTLRSDSAILLREQLNEHAALRQDFIKLWQDLESQGTIQHRPIRICCIVPHAYSLFNPMTHYIFGGSEVRAWLLGTGLARNPQNEVTFIVYDHGQTPVEVHNQVKVYRASSLLKTHSAPPEILWPQGNRTGKLLINEYEVNDEKLSFMSYVDADIYCIWGVHNLAAEIAAICKRDSKKLILFGGSDSDFSVQYSADSQETDAYGRTGYLCYYAIMQSNLIITQTHSQAELLQKRFGRSSITLYNPMDLSDAVLPANKHEPGPTCLWIGKSDQTKQPDLALLLASRFPDVKFVMVMNRSDPQMHEQIIQTAAPNVHILESISFHEAEKLFREAFVLINTSRFEGFPNTFLQAGKYGIPILSLQVNPDSFIDKFNCGINAQGKFQGLEIGLRRLIDDREFYNTCANSINNYVKTYHDLNDKVNELNQIIKDMQEG
jgi:glycosyltransferase involved in cell wall biosynthesis